MDNRRLWWDHHIPAYFVNDLIAPVGDKTDDNLWFSVSSEAEATTNAAQRFNVPEEKIQLKQDEKMTIGFRRLLFTFLYSTGWIRVCTPIFICNIEFFGILISSNIESFRVFL